MKRLIKKANVEVLHDDVCYWDGTKTQLEQMRKVTMKFMRDNDEDEDYIEMVPELKRARALIIENDRIVAWFYPMRSHTDETANYSKHINLYINIDTGIIDVEMTNDTLSIWQAHVASDYDEENVDNVDNVMNDINSITEEATKKAQELLPEWTVRAMNSLG